MAEGTPTSLAHGLFMGHFVRGKELYDEHRYVEAERELEEAYLIRPRDAKVLNLLGVVYFKQQKLLKAEEVYRKLAADSPDANTLFYNLGLIYFKLGRLEEAEAALLKALDSTRGNPKINLYLGTIYERMQRFQDAIFQYRQAGATLMVRRVEGKLGTAAPKSSAPAVPAGAGARPQTTDDTAEFRSGEVRTIDPRAERRQLKPVGPGVLAEKARKDSDTARFRLPGYPPRSDPGPAPATLPGPEQRSPDAAKDSPFRLLESSFLEATVAGKLFAKQGTVYSYGGDLTFWVKERRPGGQSALVIITGKGKVILTDRERAITFLKVAGEPVYLEPSHLLACEDGLAPRYVPTGVPGLDFLQVEGHGTLALSLASKPLTLAVSPDCPLSLPVSSLILWSGPITPSIVDDEQISEVMLPAEDRTRRLIRLAGTGQVLVERTLGGR
jgi:Flp pilus assembly protein TadD/uncharacterized protein (AIM24 family)